MIPIGLNRNTDEDRKEYLRNAPGCDDKYGHGVDNPHHIDVSEDLVELKQERHLQRCHGDVVDNHDRVGNLFASLENCNFNKTRDKYLCALVACVDRRHAGQVFRHKDTLQDIDHKHGHLERHVNKAEQRERNLVGVPLL